MKTFRGLFTGEKALLQVTWIHSGGEASKKKHEATGFRWRDCVYRAYIMLQWEKKWLEMDVRGFMQNFQGQIKAIFYDGTGRIHKFPRYDDAGKRSRKSLFWEQLAGVTAYQDNLG